MKPVKWASDQIYKTDWKETNSKNTSALLLEKNKYKKKQVIQQINSGKHHKYTEFKKLVKDKMKDFSDPDFFFFFTNE